MWPPFENNDLQPRLHDLCLEGQRSVDGGQKGSHNQRHVYNRVRSDVRNPMPSTRIVGCVRQQLFEDGVGGRGGRVGSRGIIGGRRKGATELQPHKKIAIS